MAALELLGISLFVIGILMVYLLFKLPLSNDGFYIGFALAILMLSTGTYLIYVSMPWYVIIKKLVGMFLVYLGYWFTFVFPDSVEIQHEGQSIIGIVIGALSFIWGIYLLIF